jgi:ribonuclease BN (tRNA processing enzyme)
MASVGLRFLGSGDAFASGGRFQACLMLEGGEQPVLIDCGASSLVALKRSGIDPGSIGWVLVSHLHGDHFAGLPWLILDGQFAGRSRTLVIAGPPGTGHRLEQAFEALYPGGARAERAFGVEVVELVPRMRREVGPTVVTPFEVVHGGGATPFALRVEYAGKVIGYSGDTEWTDSLIEAARGADLFVCECNFFDRRVPGHLDYRTLASKRAQLDCRRLVITHMSEEMLAHLDELDVGAAHDGLVVTV